MVEKMRISTGLIIVVVAIVIFYLRVAMLRGRKKRYEREFALKRRKVKGRSKGAALPNAQPGSPPYQVISWWLVALSFLLIVGGMVVYNKWYLFGFQLVKDTVFIETYSKFWYVPITLGILVLALSLKIQKPIIDD
jgi:hypothetical protein